MIPTDTLPSIYLKPGEYHFATTPTVVSTVLGSCISVTMHEPKLQISAICHAILPEECEPGDPFRYVDSAIVAMLKIFNAHGIKKTDLDVKLFGGSDILPPSKNGYREMTVGKQNILQARKIIEREKMNLIAYDVGGTRGRKIFFHTHSGIIYLKRLRDITR